VCKGNARAWRDYGFREKRWEGAGAEPFATATARRPVDGFPLRDKVFSALNTSRPMVRSITPAQGAIPEEAVEFDARIIVRSQDEVFFTWSNDVNKVWLAVVDLRNLKATVTQTFVGLTSIGADIETLDCK
jgi:hypothetical protein